MANPLRYRDPYGLALDDWTGFPSPDEHYGRNRHNRCPPTPPPVGSKTGPPKWSQDPWSPRKYRSTDGSECIYDTRGNPVPGGTYNYSPWRPASPYWPFLWPHIWKDVIPHFWYGGDYYPVGGPP
jgi:hypothetical protein